MKLGFLFSKAVVLTLFTAVSISKFPDLSILFPGLALLRDVRSHEKTEMKPLFIIVIKLYKK